MGETRYSLIVPVYKNEATIDALVARVRSLDTCLGGRLEAVFVVDGSPDQSYPLLKERLQQRAFAAQLICLSRNFGSFAAIRMGLAVAGGPYYAVMAADLQEPAALIEQFFAILQEESVDIVIGARAGRDDPRVSATSARLFWATYRRLVQKEMPAGGVDMFGCNRPVRDALLGLEETNSSLVGQLLWLGFRRREILYRRLPRTEGKSGWTFRRKLRYMLDSLFSFTDLPITVLMLLGGLGIGLSVALSVAIFVLWLAGAITVPGYTPIILAIFFSLFVNVLALGVIGNYVWRSFENTKRRPLYLPMSHDIFPGGGHE